MFYASDSRFLQHSDTFWPCNNSFLFSVLWSRLDSKQKFFITRPKSSKDPFLKNSASTEKRWFLALLMTWSIVQVHYELTYEVICLSSWLLFDQKYVNVCKYYAAVKNTTYPEYRSYISILLTMCAIHTMYICKYSKMYKWISFEKMY